MENKGQENSSKSLSKERGFDSFVLDKGIFSNVFGKDIKRVYIYKKAERLARALHLISPAFSRSLVLARRTEEIAIALVDAAVLPPNEACPALSRELLALSSLLAVARTGSLLSPMNADLIAREAHVLLEEVATYEEPRLSFETVPTLAEIAKAAPRQLPQRGAKEEKREPQKREVAPAISKGHLSDIPVHSSRREAILSVLEQKGPSYIKDISTVVREVSEKTIQRELQALVGAGKVTKEGERRWTRYSIVRAS
jgi:DNA-binding transcriptional ArsR family regulator